MAIDITGKVGWWGAAAVPAGPDADAQAFITAANITNTTQQSAIDTLVKSLKSANIWTKMKALYPFVGGTAAQHRFNLKDPRAVDAAFYLTFYGGGTHSSNGYQPNGNSYADTKLIPSSTLNANFTHLSYYSRTSSVGNSQRDIAAFQNGINPNICIGTNTGVFISDSTNYNVNRLSANITDSLGLFIGARTANNVHKLYKNGSQIGTTDTVVELNRLLPNIPLFIAAANVSPFGITSYSTKEFAIASIGDGLTDAESAAFYTAVQTFQTTLGRQV